MPDISMSTPQKAKQEGEEVRGKFYVICGKKNVMSTQMLGVMSLNYSAKNKIGHPGRVRSSFLRHFFCGNQRNRDILVLGFAL